ncbi:MAG: zinc-ribbon domain-containing protein [Deltaproteobacteria bacterium]|nr:zinc-ribbon domain-containing protein [Deltaproteobacteria bacterium]
MEVTCSNCQARLKIPDEKIPDTGRVTANCPKCKGEIFFEKSRPDPEPRQIQEPPEVDSAVSGQGLKYRDEDPFSLDFYEEGAKLALLMLSEAEADNGIRDAVEGLRHKTVLVQDAGESINKMRFHLFDLLVLSEHFEGVPWAQSSIFHYLNRLPMHTRRKSFLVLLGSEFSTMDHMTAFGLSADLVVNPKDMNEFSGILKTALWNQENFYGAFTKTLKELDKG